MSYTPPPLTFAPVAEQELWIARELQPGVIPSSPGMVLPVTSFKPSNKPGWITDESYQGSMAGEYGMYQGPLIASWDAGGHVFGDTFPLLCWSVLGDYTSTGSSPANSTTLSAAVAAGATTASVTSATGWTEGDTVQLGSTGATETLIIASVSGTTVTFTTPARFAHASAAVAATVTGPYTHVFALLNGSTGAAAGPGQPPTLTATHFNGISANGADQFAYSCLSELVLTGNAEKLLDWTAKATCMSRQTAASATSTAAASSEQATPSWRTTVGIGGTVETSPVLDVAEHTITITRAVGAMNTEQGAQTPFVIARGKLTASGKITIAPAIDDSSLTDMLDNTQPQTQWITDNGLSGTAHRSVQVDILLTAYDTDDINDGKELFGYDPSFKAMATSATANSVTTTGASGGKSPLKITVINNTPAY